MFGADPREHDFARELTRIRAELRETKLELNRLKQSVNSATNSVPTVISTKYTHPITTLLYGSEPQIRLQESSNQYTQYDVLGRLDYGSDPQQKQASIYVRRGATGGASDYPTDIIFEIINDGGTAMVTIAEFLHSNRVNLNGLTTINAQNGDADLLVLQDRDTTIHTFEIDGDITTEAASSAGMQFIYNNTQNSGTAAFAEFIAAITPVSASAPLVTMGASISSYNGSYLGNYAWIHAQQRDLYLVANGVEADDQAIHFGTGAGSTAIASRGNVNASGLILSTGARLNEFSTDGTLAGNSDVAAPTEKAVKTYVDNGRQRSIFIPARELHPSNSAGTATFTTNIHNYWALATSGGIYNYIFFQFYIPPEWQTGSTTIELDLILGYNGTSDTSFNISYYLSSTTVPLTLTTAQAWNIASAATFATGASTGTTADNIFYVNKQVTHASILGGNFYAGAILFSTLDSNALRVYGVRVRCNA